MQTMRPSLRFVGTRAKGKLFQGTSTKEEIENNFFVVCVCVGGGWREWIKAKLFQGNKRKETLPLRGPQQCQLRCSFCDFEVELVIR